MIALVVPLFVLSAAGLAVAAVSHVAAWLGVVPFSNATFEVVTGGMGITFLAATFLIIRVGQATGEAQAFKFLLTQAVWWVRALVIGLFVYMLVIAIAASGTGSNSYVVGEVISAAKLRTFSAAWLALYGIGFAVSLTIRGKPALLLGRKCPAGHPVRASDQFCATCGAPAVNSQARNQQTPTPKSNKLLFFLAF
ncbi:hypothetical protein RF679_15725 [Undibacterium cyanobacteriorum]|uniref:Uncharacterized protein n=1 Tax=Undibacterium cyanobacteriorum TaxID=3073561 RepID=A0ABY9RGV0_9BURK|nr:hypothetical protein [Undibacterium sp. 20NA77.5]WMW80083.1 hypothetical protein RF679_15725 [Undibacterium sp. 20NA77.5]